MNPTRPHQDEEHEPPSLEAVLAGHVGLSEPFQRIAPGLQARWQLMSSCTAQSAPCACVAGATLH